MALPLEVCGFCCIIYGLICQPDSCAVYTDLKKVESDNSEVATSVVYTLGINCVYSISNRTKKIPQPITIVAHTEVIQ